MTTRLVYSPRVYVFTKDAAGNLYDLTDYVVSGEVVRNISQVSSATVVLRNPFRIFTTPSAGVAFHPQDPITIYLERIAGYPVRVFTGYLDQTPYYQLQPGVITLEASCTLKRLLYTFFDPSLPYVISFFQKYGWENSGSGSIFSPGASSATNSANAGSTGASFNDSSFAKLLWAVLYEIGNWQHENIWIEPLPKGANGLVARMEILATSMELASDAAQTELSAFLNAVIGGSGQGSGGGSAATFSGGSLSSAGGLTVKGQPMTSNQLSWANLVLSVGQSEGASSTGIATVMLQAICESGLGEPGEFGWDSGNQNYGGLLAGSVSNFSSYGAANSVAVATAQIQYALSGGKGYNYPGGVANLPSNANIAQAAETNSGSGSQYEDEATKEGTSLSKWAQEAQNIVAATGTNSATKTKKGQKDQGSTTTQSGTTSSSAAATGSTTVYDAIIMGCNALASSGLPYPSPPKHYGSLSATWPAYDCSGSVSYALYSAGLIDASQAFATGSEEPTITGIGAVPGYDSSAGAVNIIVNPGLHTFMEIGGSTGRFWGTTDGTTSQVGCGAWCSQGNTVPANLPGGSNSSGFVSYHIPHAILQKPATYHGSIPAGGTDVPATGSGGTSGSGATGTGTASINPTSGGSNDAFVAQLTFPSIQDSIEGILLGAEGKGLMHDQALMPFVQQVCQASMRSFQSLPNGDFFAFYPDYFGEMGQHEPYWLIDDVEILNGEIDLTDDALATHVYAVGDNTYPVSEELMNELFSAGTITIFNAFQADIVDTNVNGQDSKKQKKKGSNAVTNEDTGLLAVMDASEATEFIKRFGARPLVQNYPQVRSTIFEMMLAYQQFMLAWSNQFVTPFSFTFMPEVFPGGKVAFPSHGFKMYVNQVTHTFDYTEGFTTTAQLSAPSLYGAGNPDLPANMVAAIAEPVLKNAPKGNAAAIQAGAAGNPAPVKVPLPNEPVKVVAKTPIGTVYAPVNPSAPFLHPLDPVI
jgi:hypothetical protein